MPTIEVYTSPFCPFCQRAKALLKKKGVAFTEVDVFMSPARRQEMVDRAGGRRTVPQVFVDGVRVGDCDEVHALDARGELDALLAGNSAIRPAS